MCLLVWRGFGWQGITLPWFWIRSFPFQQHCLSDSRPLLAQNLSPQYASTPSAKSHGPTRGALCSWFAVLSPCVAVWATTRLRWLLALEVFLALGAMWTVGSSSGAWPKHKEPAEVAQQAVVRKAAPRPHFTADAHQDAIPKRSERIAAIISSSVTLATSDSGPLETAANPRPLAKC